MSPFPPSSSNNDDIRRLLEARTGLSFRPDQVANTDDGIRQAMQRANVATSDEFLRRLQHDAEVLDHLVVELTVGETYFFREEAHFDFVRDQVLPEVQRRQGPDHLIRIWSAACASGEEPYSLAILCEQLGLASRAHVLATDVSSEALAKARRAVYRRWSLRGGRSEQVLPYLRPVDDSYQLIDRIRNRVQFEFLNLALDVYPSLVNGTRGVDLIFCRNVLIYFSQRTIAEVFHRLYNSLTEGGWLITASGDPHADRYAPFESAVTSHGVFYRKPLQRTSEAAAERPADRARRVPGSDPPRPRPALPEPAAGKRPTPARLAGGALAGARSALDRGDYQQAADLTAGQWSDPAPCAVHVQALANIDAAQASQKGGEACERHPLAAELHYLHGVILMGLNRDAEAIAAVQRAVFLDRTLAIAQFTLGSLFQRRGDLDAAWRSFRNARDFSRARPRDEPVPLAPDETLGRLAEAAECQMNTLKAVLEPPA